MYTRLLNLPNGSILLFGPRGTGKSTWIRQKFNNATFYDLLDSREVLRLERNPQILYNELENLPAQSWVVLDEVQKVPSLMDEVHRLIENKSLRFILCGSSARKLKRAGSNLLAGRAVMTNMFPLTSCEMGKDFDVASAITHGTLPMTINGQDSEGYLTTYADTYLNEEIRAEALTRNVGSFSRFLEIAARQNAQATNFANISRDASVARSTVQNFFDILVDTLIGYWVPAWKLKHSTKQVSHSKFYLFDTGVARTLSGRLPYPPTQEELGPLLETLIFSEFRAYLSYRKLHYKLFFWRNYDGAEVDMFCETQNGFIAIEIKAAKEWQRRFNRGLNILRETLSSGCVKAYGVYMGEREAMFENVQVLPVTIMLERLWQGEIIS